VFEQKLQPKRANFCRKILKIVGLIVEFLVPKITISPKKINGKLMTDYLGQIASEIQTEVYNKNVNNGFFEKPM